MAKVIAIANQKGGVGKTMTTLSLGAALASRDKKVLLIDLDSQGSLSISCGIDSPDTEKDTISNIIISEIGNKPYDAPSYAVHHIKDNLDLIPGNISLAAIDVNLAASELVSNREGYLKRYIDKVSSLYDYILIDCMPSLGLLTINALVSADSVLIPMQAHYLAVKGLVQLIKSINMAKQSYNPSLSIEGIVFTMVDERTNIVKDTEKAVIEQYGSYVHVFSSHIPFSVKAIESTTEGVPVFDYAPKSKLALAYSSLADEVIEYDSDITIEGGLS